MSTGGLPLLSGPPPPEYNESDQSCRKCDKEFNILFARSRKCNHCGYQYCHSCSDFQALLPRAGTESGYDVVPVCAFCIDNLTITAGGKGHLRSLPLARLKKYANAYNIKVNGVFEKDDLIDTLIAARERNGCLPRANEDFYRKYSVPNRRSNRPRGIFTRARDAMGPERPSHQPPPRPPPQQSPQYQARQRTTSGPSSFPRPDLDPQRMRQQQQPRYNPPPQPPPRAPQPEYRPRPSQPPPASSANLNVPGGGGAQARGRTRAASAGSSPRMTSPAPPVPTLDELLQMSEDEVAHLSIGTLKAVLFQNHVNARLVVEKGELVAKVRTLLEEERRERERHAREAEEEREEEEEVRREMEEAMRRSREDAEENERRAQDVMEADADAGDTGRQTEPGQESMQVDEDEGAADSARDSHPEVQADAQTDEGVSHEASPPPPPPPPKPAPPSPPPKVLTPKAQAMASRLERTGLCVICQDEEANIAIVDCGHLCLCRPCSELIMKSSRECPLCRTRIVTEQRLLRIFRT